jgi:hypothetical protein
MSEVITTTRPNAEGEMLWWVTFSGSYYDSDPRGPGDVPVTRTVHVLARDHAEALRKAEPYLAEAKEPAETGATTAGVVTLEELLVCKLAQTKGFYGRGYSEVTLTDPRDAQRYALAVCLVPIK